MTPCDNCIEIECEVNGYVCPLYKKYQNFCPNCGAETTFDDFLNEQLKDPEFKKEWDKLCDEE